MLLVNQPQVRFYTAFLCFFFIWKRIPLFITQIDRFSDHIQRGIVRGHDQFSHIASYNSQHEECDSRHDQDNAHQGGPADRNSGLYQLPDQDNNRRDKSRSGKKNAEYRRDLERYDGKIHKGQEKLQPFPEIIIGCSDLSGVMLNFHIRHPVSRPCKKQLHEDIAAPVMPDFRLAETGETG